jgi:BASS family bile acid:Na+ symporter
MIEKVILPSALIALMFALGMTLRRDDFTRVARRKRIVVASLLSIFLAMPLFALGIGRLFDLDVPLSTGLVLLAACPGGMFSNMVTHSARGDLALSVTLTVSSTLIYAIVAALFTSVILQHSSLSTENTTATEMRMMIEVVGVVIVPLLAGMALRKRRPGFCTAAERPLRIAAALLVVAVFVGLGYSQLALIKSTGARILSAVGLLDVAGWAMAGFIGMRFRLARSELIAIGVEHSIRQEGTGVFVAVSVIGSVQTAVPLLVNSFLGLLISIAMNAIISRLPTRPTGAAASLQSSNSA